MHEADLRDGDSIAVIGVARPAPEHHGPGASPGPLHDLPGLRPADEALPALTAAWTALEDAGLAPDRPAVPVALFADDTAVTLPDGPDAALGHLAPRHRGPDPVAAAVAALRAGECRHALVIGAATAGTAAAVLTTAAPGTFRYRLQPPPGAAAGVPGLVDAARRPAQTDEDGPDGDGRAGEDGRPDDGRAVPLPLSAHSSGALRARARDLRAYLAAHPGRPLRDIAHSLATTRSDHPHRALVVGTDRERLAEQLDRLADGAAGPTTVRGTAREPGRTAFVCPGHGPQWPGMAKELYETFPVFAERLDACAEALAPHVDWPVPDVLLGAPGTPSLSRPEVAQPALWATTVALADLWRSFGVVPDAVIGSSAGEITAATVAGALTVADGARAVAVFSRAQTPLLGRGVMLSVLAPADEVRPRLAGYGGELELTAVYAPRSVVVSGTPEAATAFAAELAADAVRTWRIALGIAGHSRQVEPLLDRLREDLAFLTPRATGTAYYSATTGTPLDPRTLTADYWCRVMRSTVEFEAATRALLTDGHGVLLEVSPHPVLTHTVEETLADAGAEALVTGTLRRYQGGPARLFTALGELYAHGVRPRWSGVFAGQDVRTVPLPTYPFATDPAEDGDERPEPATAAPGGRTAGHPAGSTAARLAAAGPAERRRELTELVHTALAEVLGPQTPRSLDPGAPLSEQGLDSVGATELRNLLNAATGLDLPVTLVFDHPTTAAVTDRLDRAVTGAPDPALPPAHHGPADDEPVAIVAMSCRLPGGVRSPEELWELVSAGGEAYTPFPTDRGWPGEELYDPEPGTPGRTYQREAGFLLDADRFDAAFFGISPREALAMDPQQRVLLEISWEALERAGIDPATLRGDRAGVFVGAIAQDYGPRLHQAPADLEGHLLTGNTASVASGRISYALGLTGPAVTVDTACSSSLVALHLARQALLRGECTLALAGGVTVLSTPGLFVEFARQRALAPDGRCKAFSADADGFGIAEGAGMVVVERLSDARRNGHPVLAVLRGSAVNQDGASNGLTAPSGPSQRALIGQALAAAGLTPDQVDAVEAHGTGTRLGDPIEAGALIEAYGRHRTPDRPLWLGSLKSNIGHTQAAAGIAGVIKTVLALRHGRLPRTLHAEQPSPHIDWSAGTVRLLTESRPWPATGAPRRAAVSSFGVSGTNAHAVLEQAPAEDPAGHREPAAAGDREDAIAEEPATAGGPAAAAEPEPAAADEPGAAGGPDGADASVRAVLPWVLSARSEAALRAQARRLRAHLTAHPGPAPADVGHSLLATRSLFEHRAVVVGEDHDALLGGLAALADGEERDLVVTGRASAATREAVFVFPGQGSQWLGMGAGLWDASPVFRATLQECADALGDHVTWPVVDVVRGTADPALLERVDVVQPALWAVMVSLAAVWRSAGVRPAAVVGHSQGEIAAACVAGALTLADAARAVALRSRALTVLSGTGGMVSLALPAATVRERLARWPGRISVAAVNGPRSVVVAGDRDALAELVDACEADEISTWWLPVDYASHSSHVDRVREDLLAALEPVRPRPATVPMISTVTGEPVTGTELDARYWYRNLRETVEFDTVVSGLVAAGHRAFIEVSPHPVLTVGVRELVEAVATDAVVVGTLRRDEGGPDRLAASLARAFVHGVPVDWSGTLRGGRRVDLPTYPFQGRRYWLDPGPAAGGTDRHRDGGDDAFWAAVEREDLAELSRTLGADGDTSLAALLPALAGWRRRRTEEAAVDAWRHRVTWRPVDIPADPVLPGRWLLVVPADRTGHPWAAGATEALRGHGAEVVTVEWDGDDRAALAERLRDASAGTAPDGVLSLLALDERPEPGHPCVPRGLAATAALIGALGDTGTGAPLWLATAGAVSTGPSDPVVAPVQAQVWGLGLAAGLEHPDRWGGLVDLPAAADRHAVRRLAAVVAGPGDEDQFAVRATGVSVRRLAPAPAAPAGDTDPFRPRGTVLVTGGTGALGGHVARWLAGRGAAHLVLAGRRGPDAAGAAELAAELGAAGATVEVVACDTADRTALAELIARLEAEDRPVRAVFHAAGVAASRPLADTGTAELADVLAAKAAGAAHLDELLADRDLDAFVLFSSASAVWGGAGLGAYGAANAYLDALAQRRRARGLPALSVAWGMWDGPGMSAGGTGAALRRLGLRPLPPERALAALVGALDRGETTVTVADVDWARFATGYTAARPRPLLDELPGVPPRTAEEPEGPAGHGPGTGLAASLAALPEAERHRTLLELVRAQAAAALGSAPEEIAVDRPFREQGFDSLLAVEARNRINEATGLRLPTTVVFDHPTAEALAHHLGTALLGSGTRAAPATARPAAAAADEPIAVVAMACRYPGEVRGPEDLWELVRAERDAVGPFPTDRGWDLDRIYEEDAEAAGHSTTREGGFLYDVAAFDADFFGISPREALAMDPQQRQILELSWETFERAGIDPRSLRESPTAVFVGASAQRYGGPLDHAPHGTDGYRFTGDSTSVLSGRVAYVLGLRGPALTVDTACSSSLVAVDLACASLWRGECTMALAGGVAVMVTPTSFSEFSRQGGLAADGRCKPFAEAADGTGWGEGAGLLLLERLSDARRNGHPVLALVRATAVNQDGASNGLTAPSGPAQERVIRQALGTAGLTAADVDAVEAHGTGTTLGDPIEARALLATYGRDRPADRPLWLGSLKSNIGHTQWAAGVGGVIKMVQALRHGLLPRTLHVDRPTSHVDWDAGDVRLLTEARPWPEAGRPRRAAVSSFGVSGTNAHAILEQAPAAARPETGPAPDTGDGRTPVAWALSARTPAALREQAARLRAAVADRPGTDPADVAHSLAAGRAALEHRAVALGATRAELLAALDAIAEDRTSAGVRRSAPGGGKRAVLFPGAAAPRPGTGRELHARCPVFADALDAVCAHLDAHRDLPLREVLHGDDPALLDDPAHAEPALFALEVALFRLWESWGLRPDAVAGEGVGELAALHVAGVLSSEDAAALVAARAALPRPLPHGGAQLLVAAGEEEAVRYPAVRDGRVTLAAVHGPGSLVVCGPEFEVRDLAADLQRRGREVKRLPGGRLFPLPVPGADDPAAEAFRRAVERAVFRAARLPVVPLGDPDPDGPDGPGTADHWLHRLARPARLPDAVAALRARGVTTVVEGGPGDALTAAGRRTAPETAFVPLLHGRSEAEAVVTAAAELFVHGAAPDPAAYVAGQDARRVELPTYPFQRERYWLPSDGAPDPDRAAAGLGLTATGHPLLGAAVALPEDGGTLFTGRLSAGTQPWLADHVVGGRALFPGTGFVELALHAARHCGLDLVEELTLRVPLTLPERGGVQLRLTVGAADDDGRRPLDVHARAEHTGPDGPWTRHASGTLADGHRKPVELPTWPPHEAEPLDTEGMYDRAAGLGYHYGSAFRAVRAAWRVGEDVCAEVALPVAAETPGEPFGLHPALLDAALHAPVLRAMEADGGGTVLPLNWAGVRQHGPAGSVLRVRWSPTGPGEMALAVADERGRPVATVDALTMRPADLARLGGPGEAADRALFEVEWLPVTDTPDTPPAGPLTLLGTDGPGLAAAGLTVETVDGPGAAPPAPRPLVAPCPVRCPDDAGPAGTAAAVRAATRWALDLARTWAGEDRPGTGRLVVLTRDAVHTDRPDPAQAAAWGLVSSAQSEHPGRFALVDLDATDASRAALPAALATDEPRLAVRDGEITAPRFTRALRRPPLAVPPAAGPWRLDIERKGSPDGLALVPHPAADRPLAPGEVRIAVRAAGVNFLDVLLTLDAGPDGYELGSEVAGVVTETAPDVTSPAVGDRVMGLVTGQLGPVAVADRRMLVRVPDGWSHTRAASVPVAFLTAYYGLRDLAGLRAGEAVLIHAAAGGVGMAAVQLARHWGAEVFATASPAKWHAVRAAGVPATHLASSRDLAFAERFAAATGGRGVDVVLNSLVREFTDASLNLLPRGGRFVEMGKKDLRDPTVLATTHPGVSYHTYDLASPGPDRIQQMLTELVELFESGALRPLPTATWDVRRAPDAFRHFGRARHIGKLVLTVPRAFDPGHTVLVTGGLGTLGRALARHLVTAWGARHLLLTTRRGPAADGAQEFHDELRALGAEVTVAACDVADRDALAALLGSLDRPLGMVVHAAGVLADGVLSAQTPERTDRVLAPKVDGTLHLDELTRDQPLSAFVVFSSVAGTLGGAGQAGYGAANAALDALVRRRRTAGLPAVCLAWGLWAETSGLTGTLGGADLARLTRAGITALTTEDGLALFDAALADGRDLLAPVRLDPATLRPGPTAGAPHPLLRALVRPAGPAVPAPRPAAGPGTAPAAPAPAGSLKERLAALPAEERHPLVLEVVRTEIANVLGHATTDRVTPGRALKDLGFDSLTVIELRNRLNAATGLRLPATLAFDHPTATAIADFVLSRHPLDAPGTGTDVLAEIDRLEAAVLALAKDPAHTAAAERIDTRLRTLVARWGGARDGGPEPAAEQDLTTATDRELFAFLDEQLEAQDPDQ